MYINNSEKIIHDYNEFISYKDKITKEMIEKGLYGPDILLMSYSVSDTIDILLSKSETFQVICSMDPLTLDLFQKYFLQLKEKYKKSLMFDDRKTFTDLIGKVKDDSKTILPKPKENISFKDKENKEEYIKEILMRLKDCVNLYYSAYHNKQIEAELSNGEYIYIEFLERNLLHMLGITKKQILLNTELKKMLNIPNVGPDAKPIAILEKIIADLEGNQYIIEAEFKRQVEREQTMKPTGQIANTQFKKETKNELLPFDKIDLKTRAFMSDSPYQKVSTFVPLAPGEKLSGQNDLSDVVKISKNTLVSEKTSKYVDSENAEVRLKKGNDYNFTGYGMSNDSLPNQRVPMSLIIGSSGELYKYKQKFKGQRPYNILSIKSPINGNTTIFSPQEQFDMYLSLLEDFGGSGGMNLTQLLEELKEFTYSYEERIMNEIEKRKNKSDGYNFVRKK
ncbi:MAG: hypothetical protein E7172_06570 [Firmicutes bacterium]|nr:hypothetical protein [Bacillota bacterium]